MSYNPEELVFDKKVETSIEPILTIDEKPTTWYETILYALQVTLVDFTPFIWAGAFVTISGLSDSILPTMISMCFLAMGIGTLIQTILGNKLPIVQGPSASVMTAMGSVAGAFGFSAMWGAVIVGGIFEFGVGTLKIIGKIRKLIPPIVTGAVVATVGFVASKIAIQWIFGNPSTTNLLLALGAFLLALVLKFKGKGILSSGFIIVSVALVGILIPTLIGAFDWSKVAAEPWIALPKLFPFQNMEGYGPKPFALVGAAIIGGITGYIGSIFESLGDYAATTAVCGVDYKVKHINKGIAAEGVGCTISGLIGALPVTSYTQNVGIIAATGIASRFVVQVAAVFFILFGLSPKLAMILATIPRSVIGGVFIISASLIMFSGIDVLLSEKRNISNNLIAGTTLGAAIMLPLFASTGGAQWVNSLGSFGKMYMNSNIFIAVTVGIAMNILINYILKVNHDEKAEVEEKA